ncbi:MAG: beta strand repeat-containing protein, partial [Saprospiraceae bacterium]
MKTRLSSSKNFLYFFQLIFVFAVLSCGLPNLGKAQVLWSSATGSAWLTGSNWTGAAVPTAAQIAQFGVNPTAATGVGINFNGTTNAGTQVNGSKIQELGAVEILTARAAAFIIGNSSSTAGATGMFRLNGATVNSIPNSILRNNSSQSFTIQNIQGSGSQTTAVILGNATENVVNVDGTGNIVISSNISGTARKLTLNANSTGDLRLSGTNTFDGGIDINGGTTGGRLRIDALAALPNTGAINISNGGRLTLNIAGTYSGAAQTLTLNPNQTTNPSLDILSGAAVNWSGPVVINANVRIEANGAAGSLTFSGNMSGAGTLIKQASGTMILSNAGNALSGGTQIGNGTLTVNANSSMGTGALLMFQTSTNNTTLNLNNAAQTISSLASSFTAVSGAQTQVVTLGAGHTLTLNQSVNTTYGTGAVPTLTSTIAGAGNLIKSGAGTLTLTSNNTYTGSTTLAGGSIELGIANALSTSNIAFNGGMLSTSVSAGIGFSQNLGTLDLIGTGSLSLGTGTHNVNFAASNGLIWTGNNLTITGWVGAAGSSGTNGKIFVGTDNSGLTPAQLAKITFSGYGTGAVILSTGEIVPNNSTIYLVVNGSSILSPFSTTYGTPSAAQNFTINGGFLTADVTVNAPAGFEVSNDGTTFAATAIFSQSGGNVTGNLSVRLMATATVTGSYNGLSITISSAGVATVTLITAANANSVSPKALTITGITANNKTYDANVNASVSGTADYAGLANGETFSVVGSPIAVFNDKNVGNAKSVTVTGYSTPSTNYILSPTTLTANITAAALTVSGASAQDKT